MMGDLAVQGGPVSCPPESWVGSRKDRNLAARVPHTIVVCPVPGQLGGGELTHPGSYDEPSAVPLRVSEQVLL